LIQGNPQRYGYTFAIYVKHLALKLQKDRGSQGFMGLSYGRFHFDVILLDEAQDTNKVREKFQV